MSWLLVLLDAGLLAGLGWWLRRAWLAAPADLRGWLLPALTWRLLVTVLAALLPSQDAQHANYWGRALAARLLSHPPREAPALLWQPRLYDPAGGSHEVYQWSQTLFFRQAGGPAKPADWRCAVD